MSMTREEKLLVAEVLDAMQVDVIEAGFAMASDGDFASVKAIAEMCKRAVVCSLARAKVADIERAAEAVKPAKRSRIHTFISTSDIHLKYQFRLEKPEVLEIIKRGFLKFATKEWFKDGWVLDVLVVDLVVVGGVTLQQIFVVAQKRC